ncbi:MAG: hypothetical protein JOZ42_18005 [Acetobacteraceae bacterium]|nr:hypothetical protein [Acetobacteraceae bacterium]
MGKIRCRFLQNVPAGWDILLDEYRPIHLPQCKKTERGLFFAAKQRRLILAVFLEDAPGGRAVSDFVE